MRQLSAAARAALYTEQSDDALVTLVTVRLTRANGATTTLRITDAPDGVQHDGENYIGLPLRVTLPSDSEGSAPRARLEIDNVDRDIGQRLRGATRGEFDLALVLASSPEVVEVAWPSIELGAARWDAGVVSAELRYPGGDDEPYPIARFTPETAPGVF